LLAKSVCESDLLKSRASPGSELKQLDR